MSLNDCNRPAQLGAYAHFPGTGPKDKACRDCKHFKVASNINSTHCSCLKRVELQKHLGNRAAQKRQPSIGSGTLSCKYFEQAPPKQYGPPKTDKPMFQWGTAKPIGQKPKASLDEEPPF